MKTIFKTVLHVFVVYTLVYLASVIWAVLFPIVVAALLIGVAAHAVAVIGVKFFDGIEFIASKISSFFSKKEQSTTAVDIVAV